MPQRKMQTEPKQFAFKGQSARARRIGTQYAELLIDVSAAVGIAALCCGGALTVQTTLLQQDATPYDRNLLSFYCLMADRFRHTAI